MEIYLIRHGKTQSNIEGRYIGITDEGLCAAGIEQLGQMHYPAVDFVASSPLLRCKQTAELLFPGKRVRVIPHLKESDFGMLEGKNHEEITKLPGMQNWGASAEWVKFPGGEDWELFAQRCGLGFLEATLEAGTAGARRAAIITHGGPIMAILENYCTEKKGRYHWQCSPGEGFRVQWDGEALTGPEKIACP